MITINAFFVKTISTVVLFATLGAVAESSNAKSSKELAQEIANPLTTMIMVPIQYEYNENIGSDDDGTRSTIFFQPIIPFELSEEWNLITRTIMPLIEQKDIFPDAGYQFGLGDITESLFFSPAKSTKSGWTQGFGPVFQLDVATDDYLGLDEHGLGLSYIALRVDGPETYGFLINQVYSVEGHLGDAHSNMFMQPFFDYTTEGAMTIELTSESNYNWNESEWSIPVTLTASQFFMVGNQSLLVGGGFKYWLESTESDPEGLSLNINLYLLFPK